jgi:hypothetical protein
MSVFTKYSVGFNNVGSYQASARPFITASCDVPASGSDRSDAFVVEFPKVTKFITIRNDGSNAQSTGSCSDLRFAFASGGLDQNYFTLAASASYTADFRVTRVYLMNDGNGGSNHIGKATVVAGLTQIDAKHLFNGWEHTGGVGLPLA